MTVVVEGKNSFFLGAQAKLLDDLPRDTAWAERSVVPNPSFKYVLGKYVEADRANANNQFWAFDQLLLSQPTIANSPMNLLHHPRHVVGHFVDTEMMYPTGEQAAEDHPYIEALAVFYRFYFPHELEMVENAHAEGTLFFSMECVSDSITCSGENGCELEYAYMGPRDESYCEHINSGTSIKKLNRPHFLAGALIIPPDRPGWSGARISDLSSLVKEHQLEAEMAYEKVKEEVPDASVAQWEFIMAKLMEQAI